MLQARTFLREIIQMGENPITEPGSMIRWAIQFPEGDLEKLRDLQRPLAVVPRGDAERGGLLPPQKKRTRTN